ncbi:hypothetical protein LY76DRAFT_113777 [Colletotrichum caudatum]|nr:hypothetical protein LY76DRAFT_113777 [Colletotrichum caudatum]
MCRTWTTHAQGHSVIPPSALSLPESPQVGRCIHPVSSPTRPPRRTPEAASRRMAPRQEGGNTPLENKRTPVFCPLPCQRADGMSQVAADFVFPSTIQWSTSLPKLSFCPHPTCLEVIVSCAWRQRVGRIPPSVRDQPTGRTLVLSRPRGKERLRQTPCISWIALSISAPLLRTRTVGSTADG